MRMETLEDLFAAELGDLYDTEERLIKALPKMAKNSSSERLRTAFERHLEQTREHLRRVEQCFGEIGRNVRGATADGIKGLVEEGERIIGEIEQSPLRDAGLIAAGKRVEHYEIAAYTSAVSIARLLGHEKPAGLLEQTLREERETDEKLTSIAEETVNQEALQLGAHQRV